MNEALVDHEVLSAGAERRLFARLRAADDARRAQAARARIVRQNLRLVAKLARKFYVPAEAAYDYEDLFQAGVEGLFRAVERFEPERGFKFSTYATFWVRQSIGRFIDNNASTIRLPVGVREDLEKGRRALATLRAGSAGREPAPGEVAEASGVPERRLAAVEGFSRISSPSSLDTPLEPGGARGSGVEPPALGRFLAEDDEDTAEAALEALGEGGTLSRLGPALAGLGPDLRLVLALRFGLGGGDQGGEIPGGGEPMTLEQVGREMGMSYEAVRKREKKAIRLLRASLGASLGDALGAPPAAEAVGRAA